MEKNMFFMLSFTMFTTLMTFLQAWDMFSVEKTVMQSEKAKLKNKLHLMSTTYLSKKHIEILIYS